MSLRTKFAVLAAASLPLLAVTACGSDSTAPSAPQEQNVLALLVADAKGALSKVMDKATKSETASVSMKGTVAGEAFEGEGAFFYGKDPKVEMTISTAGTKTKVIILPPVIYLEVAEADRADIEGKRWMKMDLSAAGEQAGSAFAKQMDAMDPVRQVKTLLAAESVTVVGEETINGVKTAHYTVTVPPTTYLDEIDSKLREEAEKEFSKQGIKEVKTDVWVDEEYQPRRVHVVMGNVNDITVDYTDYGKPLNIQAPSASEVFDLAEMLDRLKNGG